MSFHIQVRKYRSGVTIQQPPATVTGQVTVKRPDAFTKPADGQDEVAALPSSFGLSCGCTNKFYTLALIWIICVPNARNQITTYTIIILFDCLRFAQFRTVLVFHVLASKTWSPLRDLQDPSVKINLHEMPRAEMI